VVAASHRGVPGTEQGSVPVARRNIGGGVESNEGSSYGTAAKPQKTIRNPNDYGGIHD